MKKLAGGIAAVIASAVMLTSMVSAEDAADTNDLLVLGDSIATGYGLEGYIPGDNSSAAGSFANKMAAHYDTAVNLAVDGRTAGELVESLTSDETTKNSIATADTIVISAGGNELLRPLVANILAIADATDLKSFGEALAADKEGKLIADIQTAVAADQNIRNAADTAVTEIAEALVSISAMNPEAEILILTIYNPFSGIPGLEMISGTTDEVLSTINTSIFAAADAINNSDAASVSVIDVNSLFSGKAALYTNITSADIHPNANGHAAIYGLLAEYAPDAQEVPADDDIDLEEDTAEETVTEDETDGETDGDVDAAADSSKGSPDTGIADVAAVAGIAILAVGAAVIAKKKN